jgi:hypothetical protein
MEQGRLDRTEALVGHVEPLDGQIQPFDRHIEALVLSCRKGGAAELAGIRSTVRVAPAQRPR